MATSHTLETLDLRLNAKFVRARHERIITDDVVDRAVGDVEESNDAFSLYRRRQNMFVAHDRNVRLFSQRRLQRERTPLDERNIRLEPMLLEQFFALGDVESSAVVAMPDIGDLDGLTASCRSRPCIASLS